YWQSAASAPRILGKIHARSANQGLAQERPSIERHSEADREAAGNRYRRDGRAKFAIARLPSAAELLPVLREVAALRRGFAVSRRHQAASSTAYGSSALTQSKRRSVAGRCRAPRAGSSQRRPTARRPRGVPSSSERHSDRALQVSQWVSAYSPDGPGAGRGMRFQQKMNRWLRCAAVLVDRRDSNHAQRRDEAL